MHHLGAPALRGGMQCSVKRCDDDAGARRGAHSNDKVDAVRMDTKPI
jgi:hypothetical protein